MSWMICRKRGKRRPLPMKLLSAGAAMIASVPDLGGQVLAASASVEPPEMLGVEASAPIQDMLRWIQTGGGTWSTGLRIRQLSAFERGLVAIQPLPALRDGILDVPSTLTLSADACLENSTSILLKVPAHLREGLARSHGLLHLCFLEHYLLLGNSSFFAPYLNSFPASLSHLPLLTTLDLTTLLQGSVLLQDIEKHRRDLENLYEEIAWDLPEFRRLVSLDNFMLTYCMVESHSHARHIKDETKPLMVPLIDLINHRSLHPNLKLGWAGPEHLHVNMGREGVDADQQLYFRYSDDDESSAKFFKQFGFVDEDLPIGVKIQFPLRRHHPSYEQKRTMFDKALVHTKLMILEQLKDSEPSEYLERKAHDFPKFCIWLCGSESSGFKNLHPDVLTKELLPFARFVAFSGPMEALKEQCNTEETPPKCNRSASVIDENAAGQFLLDTVAEHLARYPASAASDDQELLSLAASAPERPYVRIRRDEQHCLGALQSAVQEIFPTLKGKFVAPSHAPAELLGKKREQPEKAKPEKRMEGVSDILKKPAEGAVGSQMPAGFQSLASAGLAAGLASVAVCALAVKLVQPKEAHTD